MWRNLSDNRQGPHFVIAKASNAFGMELVSGYKPIRIDIERAGQSLDFIGAWNIRAIMLLILTDLLPGNT